MNSFSSLTNTLFKSNVEKGRHDRIFWQRVRGVGVPFCGLLGWRGLANTSKKINKNSNQPKKVPQILEFTPAIANFANIDEGWGCNTLLHPPSTPEEEI